jgi:hypothetical protein
LFGGIRSHLIDGGNLRRAPRRNRVLSPFTCNINQRPTTLKLEMSVSVFDFYIH